MTIVMIHVNPAIVRDGKLTVDRKFHVGMQLYAELIHAPLVTVNPPARDGEKIMDAIEVPIQSLPYRISTEKEELRELIEGAMLVYGYENGMDAWTIAHEVGVPYIMIHELDLQMQMIENSSKASNPIRKAVRRVRSAINYYRGITAIRRAHSLHCNGYPIHEATAAYNANRLLYLDSRMSADMLISDEELRSRLESRKRRPLKLLYSGRYEPLNGSLDAVKVGLECERRGIDVEMHCYGQGSLAGKMRKAAAGSRVQIHDAVPYPELVKIARTFDLFVCCHIQSDPSCTYLESMGAGLPIVGYENRMWRGLLKDSGAGFASPIGKPGRVADDIHSLLRNGELDAISVQALRFANQHTFAIEFQKRVDSINAAAGYLGLTPLIGTAANVEVVKPAVARA
jgi:colanic acid/amylovoran biosynthesis glycosyltransferase